MDGGQKNDKGERDHTDILGEKNAAKCRNQATADRRMAGHDGYQEVLLERCSSGRKMPFRKIVLHPMPLLNVDATPQMSPTQGATLILALPND